MAYAPFLNITREGVLSYYHCRANYYASPCSWNTFKSCKEILEHLEATIICFQGMSSHSPRFLFDRETFPELKTSRGSLDKNFGHPGLYNAFFSFPTKKGGYSGVAVYTDSRKAIPLKAEEGLSGILQPKPPLSPDERISMSYPTTGDIELVADEDEKKPLHLTDLDSEGRALVLDFGLFVLINLYCPNEASDERLVFKMNYHLMLQERVRTLIEEGREVIVIGDINICAAPLDHGEGHFASRSSCFYDHPARAWFRRWLEPEGCMIDMVRKFWPERKGMYTCAPPLAFYTYCPTSVPIRLEHENIRSRNKLWHADRLHTRYTWLASLAQTWRYPSTRERFRSLPCIHRPARRNFASVGRNIDAARSNEDARHPKRTSPSGFSILGRVFWKADSIVYFLWETSKFIFATVCLVATAGE